MKKPKALRDYLEAACPQIRATPDILQMFVDKGAVAARPAHDGQSLGGYEHRYKLMLIVTDYAGDVDSLVAPILLWAADNQPELLQCPDTDGHVLELDADVVANDKVDVAITLQLTERVLLLEREGGYELSYPPEPFAREGKTRSWSLWLAGDAAPVASWTEPE